MRIRRHPDTRWMAVLAISAATACGPAREATPDAAQTPLDVRVERAEVKPVARTFEIGGVIRAGTTADLTSRIVAEVREVRVRPGDRVKRGQVLVLLDDRDLTARRAQAQASLSAARHGAASANAAREAADAGLVLARAHHSRIQQLIERKSATPAELDRATADLGAAEGAARAAAERSAEATASIAVAEAAAAAAGVSASFSTIVSPFDGLVTRTHTEPGNMASPGVPLLTVEGGGPFRLELQADEARVRTLQVDDPVSVALEGAGEAETVRGRIVEVAHAVDPSAHAFTVKVALPPDAPVRSGMFARARMQTEVRDALVVTPTAIVRRGQLSLVFVIDEDGRARMRVVTVGPETDRAIEVLAGLSQGEAVIVAPPDSLVDGRAVRVAGDRP